MSQPTTSPSSHTNWLLLAILVLLWGTSFLFTTLSLESFSPVGIVAMRVLLGGIILTSFMLFKGLRLPKDGQSWLILLIYGVVGNLLPFYLISSGQQSVSSGIAGLLMAFMPLVTMILAHFLIHDEKLNHFKLIGFGLGITGVVIILAPTMTVGDNSLIGCLLILLATISYALNSVLVKRLPKFDPIVAGAGMLLVGSAVIVPIWLIQDMPWQQSYTMTAWLSVIWMGIGPTGIATLLFFMVIERAGPTFLANINYVIPVVAYFAGALVLGEAVELMSLMALGLIVLGVWVTRLKS